MGIATLGIITVRALAITGALEPLSTNAGQGAAGLNLVQFTASAIIATGVSEINTKPEVLLGLLVILAAILISYLRWRIVDNEDIDNNSCLV